MKKIKLENIAMWVSFFLCVAFFAAVPIAAFVPKVAEPEHNLYPMAAMVCELEEENDLVVIEDFNGNLWEFDGVEDWMVGDVCAVLMNDNATPDNICDDVIEQVRYCGVLEWLEG